MAVLNSVPENVYPDDVGRVRVVFGSFSALFDSFSGRFRTVFTLFCTVSTPFFCVFFLASSSSHHCFRRRRRGRCRCCCRRRHCRRRRRYGRITLDRRLYEPTVRRYIQKFQLLALNAATSNPRVKEDLYAICAWRLIDRLFDRGRSIDGWIDW